MRAFEERRRGTRECTARKEDVPLNGTQEPPVRQSREDGESEDEPASTDDGKTEESSSSHASLGVVEESVDTGVGELGGVVIEEEEVRVEPSCLKNKDEREG